MKVSSEFVAGLTWGGVGRSLDNSVLRSIFSAKNGAQWPFDLTFFLDPDPTIV